MASYFYEQSFKFNRILDLKTLCKFYRSIFHSKLIHAKRHIFQSLWEEDYTATHRKKFISVSFWDISHSRIIFIICSTINLDFVLLLILWDISMLHILSITQYARAGAVVIRHVEYIFLQISQIYFSLLFASFCVICIIID